MQDLKDPAKRGRFSRNKGRREEQQLVLYFAKKGYKAERVLRQYQQSGQPDIIIEKEGKSYTLENKSRRNSFKSIYDLYASEKEADGALRFVTYSSGTAVIMSSEFNLLLNPENPFKNLALSPPISKKLKVYNRIVKLKELKQSADFLVIKDNGKPRLFLRYWG